MSQDKNIELNVDRLMEKIRAEMRGGPLPRAKLGPTATQFLGAGWIKPIGDSGRAGDLLTQLTDLHGQEFVKAAYLTVLGREVDQDGLDFYLPRLHAGSLSKIDILGSLRYSVEGQAAGTALPQLRFKFFLSKFTRIWLVGRLFSVLFAFARLPGLVRSIRVIEQEVSHKFDNIETRLDVAFSQIDSNLPVLEEMKQHVDDHSDHLGAIAEWQTVLQGDLANTRSQLEKRADRLEVGESGIQNDIQLLQQQLTNVLTQLDVVSSVQSAVNDHGVHLGSNSDRIASIESSLQETGNQLSELVLKVRSEIRAQRHVQESVPVESSNKKPDMQQGVVTQSDSELDAFYVDLEDRFRGDEQSVKGRLSVYLPRIRELKSDQWLGALDVGCGRGEWLQLLAENGMVGQGLDLNQIMVSECTDRGLDVVHADAINFLASQPAGSLSLITGFHIIEHIPFPASLKFLEQCFRVLADDGLLILETPNPENLDVGGHNFYYDPTHNNPIPPALCKFMLESAGFLDVDIERLNLNITKFTESDDPNVSVLQRFVSDRFMVPPDYAVIARK